jgi:ABC-type multidrug transport system ATPase subunit
MGRPELILLDEPWNGLDAAAARLLCAALERRRDAGATLLIAAHAVREFISLFGAVLTLDEGRLVTLETLRSSQAERL